MGIILALIAGMFVPLTNLCIRKSVDITGSAKAFFVVQMISSLIFALLLGPVRAQEMTIPFETALFGIIAGLLLSVMLFSLGRAVETGPPGLTFAILNSATVMPGLLMAIVFGSDLGYIYNGWHALGSAVVLGGLFWGMQGLQSNANLRTWLLFVSAMFSFHVLLLALFQVRSLLMNYLPGLKSEWFTPFFFLASGLVQLAIYASRRLGKPARGEVLYGIAGGLSNMLCTFFLVRAAEAATPVENAVIFPIYSVIGILLTNLWGERLYQEKVNWRACQVCVCGLFIGTVDWKAVAAFIGF